MTNAGAVLSTLVDQSTDLKQVCKSDLARGDRLFVRTVNSLYHIEVLGNGFYAVSGGWFDRKGRSPMLVKISGCTWGGSAIKVDVVAACGLSLEFENHLVTSTIQRIILLPAAYRN